jgi:hypothetical protein
MLSMNPADGFLQSSIRVRQYLSFLANIRITLLTYLQAIFK